MSWSFRIARIAGIEVRIHSTFLLLLAWIAFSHYARGGTPAALAGVLFICVLFLCVLLHEFGHALAAARYGIATPDITLLPIGGLARLQRMPDRPVEELVVAVAGPLVNVVIALAIFLGLGVRQVIGDGMQLANPQTPFLERVMFVNVALVIFNLLPAFPMDGGRVLRAVLAMRMSYARATQIAASIGQFMAFAFGFWGLMGGNPLLLFIAFFVYIGAAQEAASAQMRDLARHSAVSDAMISDYRSLPAQATLGDAVDALLATSQHEFPVTDETGSVVGLLTRDRLITGLRQSGPEAPVASAMKAGVRSIASESSLEDAFALMNDGELPAVMVHDRRGRPIGMLTPENVGELMMVQSALDGRSSPPWRRPSDAAVPQA